MIAALGAVGVGLAWGWLAVLPLRGGRLSPWTAPALLGSSAALGVAVALFGQSWPSVVFFAAAAVLACYLHLSWLGELAERLDRGPP